MQDKKTAVVACPQCGKDVIWNKDVSPFRPFCSERCKLIDLGQWASETYSVPVSGDPEESPADDNHS